MFSICIYIKTKGIHWCRHTRFFPMCSCLSPVPLVMSGYTSRLWTRDNQPQFWNKYQVWEWLQQVMDMNQIDASSIPFQNFDMDGNQLCSLSYQDFLRAAGCAGPILFHSITDLKWSGASKSLIRGLKGGGVERKMISPNKREAGWFKLGLAE